MSDKTNSEEESEQVKIAHRWQDFRLRCVQLAIDAKATAIDNNVISTAEAIAKYVITRSEQETEKKKDE